ncbi:LA_1737 family protein [Leptospira koniambonensis]|uniref:LA_1737 family protein n=1 Tax=Leptospira koniambonensis TaxID=2484950 RepID=UPI003EBA5E71
MMRNITFIITRALSISFHLLKSGFIFAVIFHFFYATEIAADCGGDAFDDLTEERKPIIGREKEEKYKFRLPPLARVESWGNGKYFAVESLGISDYHLVRYVNYPKFKQLSILNPISDMIWSKQDNTYCAYVFPFFYGKSKLKNGTLTETNLSILHYYSSDTLANGSIDRTLRFPSFFPLAGSNYTKDSQGKEETFRYALPLLFFQNKTSESNWTQFLIFHWGREKESSYGAVLPLLYWGSGEKNSHFTLAPLVYYNSEKDGSEGSLLTPLFGKSWKNSLTEGTGEKFSYLLPFFYSNRTNNSETLEYRLFAPILVHRRYEKSVGWNTNLLFLSGWISDKNGDYKSSYLFPLFFHTKNESLAIVPFYFESQDTKFGFLPIPFFYSKTEKSKSFYVLNSYYQSEGSNDSSFLFFPLFYRSVKSDGNLTLMPLYARGSFGQSSWNYFLNTYFSWDKEGELNKSIVFPVFYHSSDRVSAVTWGPLFYRNKSKSTEESKNYFLNTYYSRNPKGELDRFVFFPLYYYSSDLKEDTTLAPLYYRSKSKETNASQTYFLNTYISKNQEGSLSKLVVFPFIFFSPKDYLYIPPAYFNYTDHHVGLVPIPFYYYDNSGSKTFYILNSLYRSDSKYDWSYLFFPLYYHAESNSRNTTVAPLYYRYSFEKSSKNYFLNTYFSWNEKGELDRSIFFPFLFYKSQEYFSFLPFLVKGNQVGNEYTYLPAFFTYWDKEQTWILNTYSDKDSVSGLYRKFYVAPFWWYNKSKDTVSYLLFPFFYKKVSPDLKFTLSPLHYESTSSEEDYSLYLLYEKKVTEKYSTRRVYPIFYSGKDSESSYWNILGFAGRGFDKEGEAKYSYLFPFYFYKKDSYRVAIPFFFRLGYDEDHYKHFGIFHYWNRSPDKDNTWIWPLLWFSNIDRKNKESFTTWFPLFWDWDNPKSKGKIAVPFYLKYEEADKTLELVLAYSSSQNLGSFSGEIGSKEKEYYLDTDISLFYNLFSISTRTSISKEKMVFWKSARPPEEKSTVEELKTETVTQEEKEGLNKYKTLNREGVRSFWGVSALFGIFSYEQGDDRRHLRLLPLSWFSWSKKTEEKIYAAPFFFSSQIKDESYFVIFPFYGRQSKGPDFLESYLLFGFLRGKQGEVRDYSILWPLTRFYYSNNSWGMRFFPLFSHEQSYEKSRTISPLYYRNRVTEGNSVTNKFHSILVPLYHSSSISITSPEGVGEKGYDTFLPVYFRTKESSTTNRGENLTSKVYTLFSFYTHRSSPEGEKATNFFSPLYFMSRKSQNLDGKENISKMDFLPIPLFFWRRDLVSSDFFLLGFYRSKNPESSHFNFLGLLASTKENSKISGIYESFRILPFLFTSKAASLDSKYEESHQIVFPLYYTSQHSFKDESGESIRKEIYTPLFKYQNTRVKDSEYSSFLSLLYYFEKTKKSEDGKEKVFRTDFLPVPGLYWSRNETDHSFFFLGFYSGKDANSSKSSFLGLIHSGKSINEAGDSDEYFRIFPFYFSGTKTYPRKESFGAESYQVLFPIFYGTHTKEKNKEVEFEERNIYSLFFKYRSSIAKDESEFSNFFSLLYYKERVRFKNGNLEKTDFLLIPGFYWYRNPEAHTFFLFGIYSKKDAEVSKFSVLGLVQSSEEKTPYGKLETSFHIFPLYFSGKEEKENGQITNSYTVIPLLYYGFQDNNQKGWNVLGIFNYSNSPLENHVGIYPFFSRRESVIPNFKKEITVSGIPYYYNKKEYANGVIEKTNVNLFGIFTNDIKSGLDRETWFLFLPLPFFYYEKNIYSSGLSDKSYTFLKLINYSSSENLKSGKSDGFEFSSFFIFSAKSRISSNSENGTITSSGSSYLFPIYWWSKESGQNVSNKHFNFLIFFDYARDDYRKESRLILGPYYYFSETNSEKFGLLPLGFYSKNYDSKFWFLLGFYGYKDSDWNRWGFAGIFDTYREEKNKRTNFNLFLGLIHTELEEERTRVALLGGILGGYEGRTNYSDSNFLWLRWKSTPDETIANVLPVFYYHHDMAGTTSVIPPVLGYFSSGKDGRFDMLGLGLLYYRNERISRSEDTLLVAGGLLYYYKQSIAPYNPLYTIRSMGVLAGLLWNWEYEVQGPFNKYSVLFGVYSRSKDEAKEIHRIFGIML